MADKALAWLRGEVKSPLFSEEARSRAGFFLRLLQQGTTLSMPWSRPMPSIGSRCHELRVRDPGMSVTWRVIYRIDPEAIVVGGVFAKKTQKTPQEIIEACQRRFSKYDAHSH